MTLLWCFGDVECLPKHHNENYMRPFMDNPTASVGRKSPADRQI
jgi:hypothetical protein